MCEPRHIALPQRPPPCSDPSPTHEHNSLCCSLVLAEEHTHLTKQLWLHRLLARIQSWVCVLRQGRPLARPICKICAMPFSAWREPISGSGMVLSQVSFPQGLLQPPPSEFLVRRGIRAGWGPQILSHQQTLPGLNGKDTVAGRVL